MNIKYLVEIKVRHKPYIFRVLNGFPLHEGDKLKDVRDTSVVFYVDNWHLHEDQLTFLLSRQQQRVLTYKALPVPGPSIARDKATEYRLVALAS